MARVVMLDASPLGKLANARRYPEIHEWLNGMYLAGTRIIVPEIADYEVRRNLLTERLLSSLDRLNELKVDLVYQPITTTTMLKAADLWAVARRSGRSTADPKELDCDVVLGAQALEAGAVVATENAGHLSRYVIAKHWRHITPY